MTFYAAVLTMQLRDTSAYYNNASGPPVAYQTLYHYSLTKEEMRSPSARPSQLSSHAQNAREQRPPALTANNCMEGTASGQEARTFSPRTAWTRR